MTSIQGSECPTSLPLSGTKGPIVPTITEASAPGWNTRCYVSLFNPKGQGVRCAHAKGHFGPHGFGEA